MKAIVNKNTGLYFFIFLLGIFPAHSIAQNKFDSSVYFFDQAFNVCNKESAVYIGIGVAQNGLINFSTFTYPGRRIVMTGFFTDATFANREGEFRSFDSTGYPVAIENYHLNKLNGLCVHNTENHFCKDSIIYENDVDISGVTYNYIKQTIKQSRIYFDSRKGVKDLTLYFDDGSIESHAHWVNGTGDQVKYYNSGKQKSIVSYTSNKMTAEKYFNENGTEIQIEDEAKAFSDKIPAYPGGLEELMQYVKDNMRVAWKSNFYDTEKTTTGKYTLVFMINKKGKAYDLKVRELKDDSPLFRRLQQVLNDAPKWDMKGQDSFGPVTLAITLY